MNMMVLARRRVDACAELARTVDLLFDLERNLVASGVPHAVAMALGDQAVQLRAEIARQREAAGRAAEQAAGRVA